MHAILMRRKKYINQNKIPSHQLAFTATLPSRVEVWSHGCDFHVKYQDDDACVGRISNEPHDISDKTPFPCTCQPHDADVEYE